jgi:hypothetical protein
MTSRWRFRLTVPLVVPLALLSLFSAVVGVAFRVRYLSWLVIPIAVWLAIGYTRTKGVYRHIAAGALIVVAAIAMVNRVAITDYRVEEARQAATYVEENPETPAVAMVWYMARPVEYYVDPEVAVVLPPDEGAGRFGYHALPNNRVVPLPERKLTDPPQPPPTQVFEETIALGEEYLLIYSREFHGDPQGDFLELRESIDSLVPVAEYAGITIYRGVRGG